MIHGNKKPAVTVIRYSCLTGQAVWLYQGPSKQAARAAYRRACEREIKRVRLWRKMIEARKANIMHVIETCMADKPIITGMTPEQKVAAKKLLAMAKEECPCQREFYNHIMEERRRRENDRLLRERMRSRSEAEK